MRLYLNLDTLVVQAQGGTGYAAPIGEVIVRRNDEVVLQLAGVLTSVRDNLDLGDGVAPDARLVIKKKTGDQRFDEAAQLVAVDFTKVEIEGQIFYEQAVVISSEAIDAALGVGEADDVDPLELSAQLSLLYNGRRQTSRSFDFTIENNYDRDEESPAPGAMRGAVIFLPAITSYLGETAADLDSVVTVGRITPLLVCFRDPEAGLRHYVLVEGTDATDTESFTVIRPADYDAEANAKVWKLVHEAGLVTEAALDEAVEEALEDELSDVIRENDDASSLVFDDSTNLELALEGIFAEAPDEGTPWSGTVTLAEVESMQFEEGILTAVTLIEV